MSDATLPAPEPAQAPAAVQATGANLPPSPAAGTLSG